MVLLDATAPVVTTTCLEKIYYISQIIGTGVLIWSAYYAKKQYESQKQHLRIEKAADLSKHFKDYLIPSIGKLQYMRNIKELIPIFDKIALNKISVFDYNELCTIPITPDEINIFKASLSLELSVFALEEFKNDNTSFSKLISTCLNDLEYFCMNFNSNIADSKTVYQSLHQTFFDLIPIAYIFIASLNTSSTNKYYTNIIAVFNKWYAIYNSQIKKEQHFKTNYSKNCDNITLVSTSKFE